MHGMWTMADKCIAVGVVVLIQGFVAAFNLIASFGINSIAALCCCYASQEEQLYKVDDFVDDYSDEDGRDGMMLLICVHYPHRLMFLFKVVVRTSDAPRTVRLLVSPEDEFIFYLHIPKVLAIFVPSCTRY